MTVRASAASLPREPGSIEERIANEAVLVVDDLAMMRDLVSTVCRRIGFGRVDVADSGVRALERMRETTYRLVISDMQMEPMSGLDLLAQVRADATLRGTPFLIMTARLDTQLVISAKRAGVDSYLVKPFTPSILRERLRTILA